MSFMNLLILLLRLRSLVLQNPQAAKEYERTYALHEEGFNKALQAEQERESEVDNVKLRNLVSADGRTYIPREFSKLPNIPLRAWQGISGSISQISSCEDAVRPIVNTLKATAKCSFLIDTGANVTAIPEPNILWRAQIATSNLGTASKNEKMRVVSIGRLLTNMVGILECALCAILVFPHPVSS